MSAVPLTRPSLASQLAVGVSRMSIRQGHFKARYRKPKPELTGYPEGWGEKIWIFHEVRSHQVVYSHTKVLDVYKAMKQLPFAGKKTKPAKIRKDLWRHLALVQFPEGKGEVGRSVFAKLREFRKRHELEWDDEMFFEKREDGGKRVLTRQERGLKIREQVPNTVADLAAVLAGVGKSNKMWVEGAEEGVPVAAEGKLHQATIYWSNDRFKAHAESWTPNVTHDVLDSVEETPDQIPAEGAAAELPAKS